ncbi:MAG TPA: hypothetical protein VHT96_07535 [Clostridia bacterium]|nr:hypothetical protein [Clostridia bacterium]
MLKRVLAWIILAGFVLLLLNIAIFHFYLQACIAIYVVIVIFFVLSSGKIVPTAEGNGNNRFAGHEGGGADTDSDIDTDTGEETGKDSGKKE